jgi:hypothetical protein
MRTLALSFVAATLLWAAGTLTAFGHRWTVPDISDWKIEQENGTQILRLATARGPLPGPRRPIEFALADTPDLRKVSVEGDMRPLGHSLMIVFAYRDPEHFDYAHLSIDTAREQSHHNGIFHVYEGERVRISPTDGPAAFEATGHWQHVRLVWDGASGEVRVTVDGKPIPALHAVDLSLRSGRVGLGSFDETAEFKNIKIE